MATIDEVRQQTAQARQLVEQKKKEIEQSKQQIENVQSNLPDYRTQKALRGNNFGGLQGRQNRAKVVNAENQLSSQLSDISQYQTEVLNPYEQQVAQSEAEIQDYDLKQEAVELARKFYDARVPYKFLKGESNPYVYEYTKQLYEDLAAQQEFNAKLNEAVNKANAGVPKEIAFKGLNLDYLTKKGYVKFNDVAVNTPESNQISTNFNNVLNPQNSINNLLGMSTRLDRTEQVKVNNKLNVPMTSFALVSAQPSSNIAFNTSKAIVNNGYGNISSGLDGTNILLDSGQSDNSISGSWWSRYTNRLKKDIQEPTNLTIGNQTFVEVSASPYTSPIGTISSLPPSSKILTYEDYTKNQPTSILANLPIIKENKRLQEEIKNQKSIVDAWNTGNLDKVNSLGGSIVSGTTTDEFGNKQSVLTLRSKTINVGGYQVPIEQADTSDQFLGGSTFKTAYRLSGIYLGNKFKEGAEKTKYKSTLAKDIIVSNPYWGTIQTDLTTGTQSPYTKTVIPKGTVKEGYYVNPTLAEVSGNVLGEGSQYLIPYAGTGLFVGDIVKGASEVGFNPIRFVKEKPALAASVGTIGLFKGVKLGNDLFKFTNEAKYFGNPLVKESSFNVKLTTNKVESENLARRMSIVSNNEKSQAFPSVRKKGITVEKDYYPTDTYIGDIVEKRRVGINKVETFQGNAVLNDLGYTEKINYPKGMKKVTTINPSGQGTIQLIDKERNIIRQSNVNAEFPKIDLLRNRARTNVVRIDTQTNPSLNVLEVARNNKINRVVKTQGEQGGQVVTDEFGNAINPALESKKIYGKYKENLKVGSNINQGIIIGTRESNMFSDIITSQARKGKIELVNNEGKKLSFNLRKGQEIVYGNPNEKEIVAQINNEAGRRTLRILSPQTSREIQQGSESGFNIIQVYDKRTLRNIQNLEKSKQELAKKLSKEKQLFGEIIDENAKIQQEIMFPKSNNQIKNPIITSSKVEVYTVPSYLGGGTSTTPTESIYSFVDNAPNFGLENLNKMGEQVVVSPLELKPQTSSNVNRLAKNVPLVNLGSKSNYGILESVKTIPVVNSRQMEMKITINNVKTETIVNQKSIVQQENKILNVQQNKLNILQENKQLNKQNNVLKELQKLNLNQELLQQNRQEQKKNQKQTSKSQNKNQNKIKEKITKIPFSSSIINKAKESLSQGNEEFTAFVSKFGKEIDIGKKRSKQEAEDLLKKELLGTLRAGGGIKVGETKLKSSEINLGKGFAPSKVNPFKVVQEKSQRLGRRSETQEIQYFKKSKKRKGVFNL